MSFMTLKNIQIFQGAGKKESCYSLENISGKLQKNGSLIEAEHY